MRKSSLLWVLVFFQQVKAQDSFQLAPPLLKYSSLFFSREAKVEIKFAQPGAKIYYTIDDKMPRGGSNEPRQKAQLYKKPLVFKKAFTTIKAKVFAPGFRPSETIELSFAKEGRQIKKITSTSPNSQYPGTGDSTLFDNRGGIINASSKSWMGYDQDTANFVVDLAKKETVSRVLLSFLQNEDSWIFLPEQILVYYFDENKNIYLPFGKETVSHESRSPANVSFCVISQKLSNIKTKRLMVDLITVKKIPDWHPAKGQHAWCFIDEIKVY